MTMGDTKQNKEHRRRNQRLRSAESKPRHCVVDVVERQCASETSQRHDTTYVGGKVERSRTTGTMPRHPCANSIDERHHGTKKHHRAPSPGTTTSPKVFEGQSTAEAAPPTPPGSSVPEERASREHAVSHPRQHDTKLRTGLDA